MMNVVEIKRFRKLLSIILDWDNDCCYWDDEKNTAVIDGTETDLYNAIMKTDEMHLLTSSLVHSIVRLYFNDYNSFSNLCREYHAF